MLHSIAIIIKLITVDVVHIQKLWSNNINDLDVFLSNIDSLLAQ